MEQGDYRQARPHLEEAHELFRELGDERMVGMVVVNLGTLAAREGRSDEAEALLHQALEYAEARVDRELAILCLSELAPLTLSSGDAERAARLTGAMETLREETGHAPSPDQQRLSEQTRSALASEPHVAFEGLLDAVPEQIVRALLPVLRELLSNVARHARANEIGVEVKASPDYVVLTVTDDGVGIGDAPGSGNGLRNMTDRATDLGGEFRIDARPGGGSAAVWRVPNGTR